MNLVAAIVTASLALSGTAAAQERTISNCAASRHDVYSDAPCVSLKVAPSKVAPPAQGAFKRTSAVKESGRGPLQTETYPLLATRLAIGMTDTQVLNLPSAGRPTQITRNREAHVWREQWVYKDRTTGEERRTLYFENGRLVQQDDAQGVAGAQTQASND